MKYNNIREEELKNKVGAEWFTDFNTTEIIGNIDFSVYPKDDTLFARIPLLWAEAKRNTSEVVEMFVQLLLTIGKARTFDKTLPPAFLGAFDFQKIAFVAYDSIQDIFYINDFNWNVTPSNHQTREFKLIKDRIEAILNLNAFIYDWENDAEQLRFFIKNNLIQGSEHNKIKIDKNNFFNIYMKWVMVVKPIIQIDWDNLKKQNILDSDFFLADLFVDDNNTPNIEDDEAIRKSLFVIFEHQGYKIAKENLSNLFGFDAFIRIGNKEIYQNFWKIYKRPPVEAYQEYIIERRDLLVPQDIRERKGAFFTPRQWVELSQKYLTDYFGEDWQDNYYIWDCAAGTGNLLAGLSNKYNIYASTLDQADVNVMHERAEHGANLLKNHCFQFDFLNDEFVPISKGGKLPDSLFDIINSEEKRKKLVIYINPPYAEAGNAKQLAGTGENKAGTSIDNKTYQKYKTIIKKGGNELYAQFLIRIYCEIPQCKIAEFSTLKILQSPNFSDFRKVYRAKLEKIFVVPANTFDNVTGEFPIGFKIWNNEIKENFKEIISDVYNRKGFYTQGKAFYNTDGKKLISAWSKTFRNPNLPTIGHLASRNNDFQNQRAVFIDNFLNKDGVKGGGVHEFFNINNLSILSIFFAVRHCIAADWLNDRDQFLYPNDNWQTDTEFQSDCLAFTLFHGQNRISSSPPALSEREGAVPPSGVRGNHWIPFTEAEVNAPERFASHFMTDFIKGKIQASPNPSEGRETGSQMTMNFEQSKAPSLWEKAGALIFSEEATAVFDAGRELWRYYYSQENINVNASLYDIREYFQGRSVALTGNNTKGRMNNKSEDEHYNQLIGNLREALKVLAEKIQPKVYEYGFLKA
ncbi:hypothetical protein [Capnocytophaga catalasegens]|uniref:Site-specific DNA-methyltransferase (adenine-specific) n=1 Tax=Capnocytophaga catalasegens TaxID=1004260 RepID=A0AAV5AQI4_9FLAO|nr:hypothetical protein [Capnocytophaga catalasegens]GIZ15661.1 hypothetical protein RCZ03_16610 [Capnocytophaga catalasegens]GJM49556.1 hypothetical protein RCZ15_05310 [Capnocytophaga catalasegens]GJM51735.1 hypothetical protein RCZ16_00530 [Capnocytophaga catalasegens]